jgi:N-acetylmuramoyl-L-alanine amidase
VQLFGVTTDTDWIRYDFGDELVDIATWSQPEPDMYELRISLTRDLWGYDAFYVGNTFHFVLNKAPNKVNKLKGKRIVIDPGHSADPGAIGPTGYTEAEANLGISLVLAEQLERKGAEVILTRDDDRDVPLYDRPDIAKANSADLFISVHNNALPDGVNPFENNGVSTYYYHPHSIDLARAIQTQMIKATGLRDHGLFHGNLAVNRPTQYPAVLIECAFMILPEQEAMLKTRDFRKQVSRAIIKGIENFLKEYDRD